MARIRTIKPDFFDDKKLSGVSRDARLTFIGLLVHADDFGVVRGFSDWLKTRLYPYDKLTPKAFEGFLSELERIGVILPFEAGDERYYHIKNFLRHQRINRPSITRNPTPPEALNEHSLNTHGALTEHSLLEREREREREREVGKGSGSGRGARGEGERTPPESPSGGPSPSSSSEAKTPLRRRKTTTTSTDVTDVEEWIRQHRDDPRYKHKYPKRAWGKHLAYQTARGRAATLASFIQWLENEHEDHTARAWLKDEADREAAASGSGDGR